MEENFDIITPAEALRMLIIMRDPALAYRALSLKDVQSPLDLASPPHRDAEIKILNECLEALFAAVRDYRVQLLGVPVKGGAIEKIRPIDRRNGQLNLARCGLSQNGQLVFEHVRCIKGDVLRLLKSQPVPPAKSRARRPRALYWTPPSS
jgi:hypothetical protein